MLLVVNGLMLALFVSGLAAIEVPAEVVSVTDGDTIVVTAAAEAQQFELEHIEDEGTDEERKDRN